MRQATTEGHGDCSCRSGGHQDFATDVEPRQDADQGCPAVGDYVGDNPRPRQRTIVDVGGRFLQLRAGAGAGQGSMIVP